MNEFDPIRMMLRMAEEQDAIRQNVYISEMVRDAMIVRHHPDRIRGISRVTYRYSVVLGRSDMQSIERMNPTGLTVDDLRQLLDFFEKL